MKLLYSIFIICSGLLIWACKKQDPQSEELRIYLKESHQLLPNDSCIYCFFPANQCKNCFLYNARFIKPDINERAIIITEFDSSNFKGFRNIYRDVNNTMIQLSVLDYGNRIITFKDGIIEHSIPVKDLYSQLDSVAEMMHRQ